MTNLQLNVINVSVGATAITHVTSFVPSLGGELTEFSADDDRYPSVVVNAMNHPTLTITSGDIAKICTFAPQNAPVTISGTYQDAMKAAGGNVVWTCTNCVFRTWDQTQQHAAFNTASGHWAAFAPDGQTPPFSFSRS